MPGSIDPQRARARLQALRAALDDTAASAADAAGTVALDQSRVGRLSRMDALQSQAMAMETQRRRVIQVQRIDSALQRLASGEYGLCVSCGEAIAPGRLEHDPAVPVCLACAAAREG